VTSMFVIKCGR